MWALNGNSLANSYENSTSDNQIFKYQKHTSRKAKVFGADITNIFKSSENQNEEILKTPISQKETSLSQTSNKYNIPNLSDKTLDQYPLLERKTDVIAQDTLEYIKENLLDAEEIMVKDLENFDIKNLEEIERSKTIGWMLEIVTRFEWSENTFYLATYQLDKYLIDNLSELDKKKIRLYALASIYIAAKYEEHTQPRVRDFVFQVNFDFTSADIIEAEGQILINSGFKLVSYSSIDFALFFQKNFQVDEKIINYAKYILETCQFSSLKLKYKNSLLACGALYIALKCFGRCDLIDQFLGQTRYNKKHVRKSAIILFTLLNNDSQTMDDLIPFEKTKYCHKINSWQEKIDITAVKRKFSTKKFLEISKKKLKIVSSC